MNIDFAEYRLSRWDELPTMPLYMDQVVYVMGEALGNLFATDEAVKPTMINNYVKNKIIPVPEKKRYGRAHLWRLIIICVLKKVLAISEIELLLAHLEQLYGAEDAYNLFATRLEQTMHALGVDGASLPAAAEGSDKWLDAALLSLAGKMLIEVYLTGEND